MKRLDKNDERVQQAIVLYKSGKAIRPICSELKMDGEALRRVLKDLGILRTREKSAQIAKSGKSVNDDAFDILTPETCYWIGFIYADGHIEKSRPRITVTLTEEDLPHLRKLANFVGCDIRQITGGYYRIAFSSQKIYDRFLQLGFTNRKTWDITPHESLKYSRDFWRGVVDGDGWIYNKKQIALGLCGHENTIKEFLSFLNINGVDTKSNPYKVKKRDFLWSCDLHSKKAISAANLLYKDATVYLDRKYQTYLTEFAEPVSDAA